jgi:hypothetical protein
VSGVVNVLASVLSTSLIASYVWGRRRHWWSRQFDRGDQLVIVFLAVAAANAAISYAYTKDVILSPAGAFFAVALAIATRSFIVSMSKAARWRTAFATILVVMLSSAWAFRAVGIHVALREAGTSVRNEWVYVDGWLERQNLVPKRPIEIQLKRQLQEDAIWKHPARAAVVGEWVEWFAEE